MPNFQKKLFPFSYITHLAEIEKMVVNLFSQSKKNISRVMTK